MRLTLATRRSALALAQSRAFARALEAATPGLSVDELQIVTAGDRTQDKPLQDIGGKGLFIKELEEALLDYAGCAVVITHDRWFLDRIATHILAFEGNSEVVWFEGNYRAYAEDFHRRKGVDAERPHRIAYRKLVRA